MIALVLIFIQGAGDGMADDDALPLDIVPPSADIGTIHNGSHTELEFIISNTGPEDIRLVYIYAQCDCSLSIPDSGFVPAGGQFVLRGQLKVGEEEIGLLDEQITILTGHPSQRELIIPVTAWVRERN